VWRRDCGVAPPPGILFPWRRVLSGFFPLRSSPRRWPARLSQRLKRDPKSLGVLPTFPPPPPGVSHNSANASNYPSICARYARPQLPCAFGCETFPDAARGSPVWELGRIGVPGSRFPLNRHAPAYSPLFFAFLDLFFFSVVRDAFQRLRSPSSGSTRVRALFLADRFSPPPHRTSLFFTPRGSFFGCTLFFFFPSRCPLHNAGRTPAKARLSLAERDGALLSPVFASLCTPETVRSPPTGMGRPPPSIRGAPVCFHS